MRWAALLAVAAALVLAAPARGQSTITMSGSVVTRALVADLAYFYRHDVADPPLFSITGGVTASGIADAANGVVSAGMVSRGLTPQDPPGLVFTPIARSGLCLVTNRANPVPGSPARRSRTSWRGGSPPGARSRAPREATRSSPPGWT